MLNSCSRLSSALSLRCRLGPLSGVAAASVGLQRSPLPATPCPHQRGPLRVLCEGGADDRSEPQAATGRQRTPAASAGREMRPQIIPGPDGEPLRVVPIEKAGKEAWAGVAAIDSGDQIGADDLRRVGTLVVGDTFALLLFAIIGRWQHGEIVDIETLTTALPFMIGWFSATVWLNGYGKSARGGNGILPAAGVAAKCWAVGIPAGIILRGIFRGYVPPLTFAIVTSCTTGVFLVGWRTAYAARMKRRILSPQQQAAQRGDRQGNPFEFLQFLSSLTKRW